MLNHLTLQYWQNIFLMCLIICFLILWDYITTKDKFKLARILNEIFKYYTFHIMMKILLNIFRDLEKLWFTYVSAHTPE